MPTYDYIVQVNQMVSADNHFDHPFDPVSLPLPFATALRSHGCQQLVVNSYIEIGR